MALIYDQSQTGLYDQNDYNTIFGSVFSSGYTLSNITKVTIYLKKINSPTGTVIACLWQGSALPQSPTQASTNTLNVNTIDTDSFVGYDFTFPGDITLTTPFKIGLAFSGSDATNHVQFQLSADILANRSSERGHVTNVWESLRPQTFTMQVYSEAGVPGTTFPPPPAYVKL